jgi:hypothetical protein
MLSHLLSFYFRMSLGIQEQERLRSYHSCYFGGLYIPEDGAASCHALAEILGMGDARRYVYEMKVLSYLQVEPEGPLFTFNGLDKHLGFDINSPEVWLCEESGVMMIPPQISDIWTPGCYIKFFDSTSWAICYENGQWICVISGDSVLSGPLFKDDPFIGYVVDALSALGIGEGCSELSSQEEEETSSVEDDIW